MPVPCLIALLLFAPGAVWVTPSLRANKALAMLTASTDTSDSDASAAAGVDLLDMEPEGKAPPAPARTKSMISAVILEEIAMEEKEPGSGAAEHQGIALATVARKIFLLAIQEFFRLANLGATTGSQLVSSKKNVDDAWEMLDEKDKPDLNTAVTLANQKMEKMLEEKEPGSGVGEHQETQPDMQPEGTAPSAPAETKSMISAVILQEMAMEEKEPGSGAAEHQGIALAAGARKNFLHAVQEFFRLANLRGISVSQLVSFKKNIDIAWEMLDEKDKPKLNTAVTLANQKIDKMLEKMAMEEKEPGSGVGEHQGRAMVDKKAAEAKENFLNAIWALFSLANAREDIGGITGSQLVPLKKSVDDAWGMLDEKDKPELRRMLRRRMLRMSRVLRRRI